MEEDIVKERHTAEEGKERILGFGEVSGMRFKRCATGALQKHFESNERDECEFARGCKWTICCQTQ
jgi:hypothetical protein